MRPARAARLQSSALGVPPAPRLADWPERLCAYVSDVTGRAHSYGSHDCMMHSAAVVHAVTGVDHGAQHRGKYRTKAGSVRYLKQLGFDSVEAMIDSLLEEKPIGFAGRGDLVIAADGIPGVCMGDFALSVGEGEAGLVRVPRSDWVKAWAVGESFQDWAEPA